MLKVASFAHGLGFTVGTVSCRPSDTDWTTPEVRVGYEIVLTRRGRFRRIADGRTVEIDSTIAYLAEPQTEARFAHPNGGDLCTWITLTGPLWASLTGMPAVPPGGAVYIDALADLHHRRLLTAGHEVRLTLGAAPPGAGPASLDDEGVFEPLLDLLAALLAQAGVARTPASVLPRPADTKLVEAAREAVQADDPASHTLLSLAGLLGVSPYRLSRAFSRQMGVSLTRFRTRVRLGWALDQLSAGADDLAGLATELGFADQSHLCRVTRQHFGDTPTALRRALHRPGAVDLSFGAGHGVPTDPREMP